MKKIVNFTNLNEGRLTDFILAMIFIVITISFNNCQLSKPKPDFWYSIYQERTELKY